MDVWKYRATHSKTEWNNLAKDRNTGWNTRKKKKKTGRRDREEERNNEKKTWSYLQVVRQPVTACHLPRHNFSFSLMRVFV